MKQHNSSQELETWLEAELQNLRELKAPPGLAEKIMARLEEEKARPRWRKFWWSSERLESIRTTMAH